MTRSIRVLVPVLFLLLAASQLRAQVVVGTPRLGSFAGGPDVLNLANLNAHLTIPVLHKPGRGLPFNFDLTYDTSVWYPVTSGSTTTWEPVSNWGWSGSELKIGTVTHSVTTQLNICGKKPNQGHQTIWNYTQWVYTDGFGTPHAFPNSTEVISGTCGDNETTSFIGVAPDGSGYTLSVTGAAINSLYASDGTLIDPIGKTATDRNGNVTSGTTVVLPAKTRHLS